MSKSVELRQKRSELWEKAKLFLDNAKRNSDVLSADDRATYEKMEQEIVDLGKEIGIIERREALDLEMSKPTSAPISANPNTKTEEKTGRSSDEYKKSFWLAMRNKKNPYEAVNALQIGTDSEGGYLSLIHI